jgi:hypothetical protein
MGVMSKVGGIRTKCSSLPLFFEGRDRQKANSNFVNIMRNSRLEFMSLSLTLHGTLEGSL